jgi:hypothetical protein
MKRVLKVWTPLHFGYWTGKEGDWAYDIRKAVVLEEEDDGAAMWEAYDHFEASLEEGEFVDVLELEDERYDKMVKWANENLS